MRHDILIGLIAFIKCRGDS